MHSRIVCLINHCECCSLDWIFAHDAIYLCMSYVHALSCIVPLFSFFPEYTLLLCFLFFSSPFSFLTMAPKKSVLSKKPITCCGSSSSSSLPSVPNWVRFCNEDSQKDFYENFSDWMINSERLVILSDFSNTSLPGVFSSQGWESLCEKPMRWTSFFIQEFYSNMHAIDTSVPQFTMVFKGTRIVVTSDFLSCILRVPRLDRPDYPNLPYLCNILHDE